METHLFTFSYYEVSRFLLEQGAKVDYREPTEELYPRTTLCDEPLRLAIRNKHYVSTPKYLKIHLNLQVF